MHEISIAQSILDISIGTASENNSDKVTLVSVRVGKMATVDEASLRFAFDAMKSDTIVADAIFEFNSIPIVGECLDCSAETEFEGYFFSCPICGSGRIKILSGDELEITHIEVE